MTANEFTFACISRTLMPELVLEEESIQEALLERDDEKVNQLLDELF